MLCKCGCGKEVNSGNWIRGHQFKIYLSPANQKGKIPWNKNLTKETDERQRNSSKKSADRKSVV